MRKQCRRETGGDSLCLCFPVAACNRVPDDGLDAMARLGKYSPQKTSWDNNVSKSMTFLHKTMLGHNF